MLTIEEVSRVLALSKNAIRRWTNQGILKADKINQLGERRFRPEYVTQFLQQNGYQPETVS